MKQLMQKIVVAVLGVTVVGIVGCEWKGGSSDNSWNDSNSLANFNGTYQANGSYLVSEYTASQTVGTGSGISLTTGQAFVNHTETQTKSVQLNSVVSGITTYSPVVPGSFTIQGSGPLNGLEVHDNVYTPSGNLTGNSFMYGGNAVTISGHVSYDTGAWSITLAGSGLLDATTDFKLDYSQVQSTNQTSTSTSSSPGSSGVSIFAFNVQQTGNKLKIIDNNGSIYEGSLGDVRTTGNLGSADQNATFVNGDQVSASFSASGTSAAGKHVNLVGTFQGTASGVSQVTTINNGVTTYRTSMALGNRTMTGTWIEDGGKTGNISGTCPSASQVSYATGVGTNRVNTSSF